MKEFNNKVAVITGAGSGFGRELALACAAEGMKLVLADVDETGLASSCDLLTTMDVVSQRCDFVMTYGTSYHALVDRATLSL